MRPEIRAEYERALAIVDGDAPFHTRLERFFPELLEPLVALYGDDPRFEAQWPALLRALSRAAAAREPELRRLDHEREITADWLHREHAVGYVCYVDRFAGTLDGVRARVPYLQELGISYLHLMPLLRSRPQPNDGGYAVADYRCRRPGAGDDGRPARAGRRAARRRDGAVHRPGGQPHRARAPVGRGRARRRRRQAGLLPHVPRPHGARRLRAHAARRLPGHRARELQLGAGARPLGVDDVQPLPVGSRLHEPGRLHRDGRDHARAGERRRRRPAPRRRAVPVEAGRDELPEPAGGP